MDAQCCAAELHQALTKADYHQASSLIGLAPHPGVFEMVNKQQQNALHLAGQQQQLIVSWRTSKLLQLLQLRGLAAMAVCMFITHHHQHN